MIVSIYRTIFGFISLILWIIYIVLTWYMLTLEEKRFKKSEIFVIPFVLLFFQILFGTLWLGFESREETENNKIKKKIYVVHWLYPYTYFIFTGFSYLLWIALYLQENVYKESFVKSEWCLFTLVYTIFVCFLALLPFYIQEDVTHKEKKIVKKQSRTP